MNDIFISYDRENRDIAQKYAEALEKLGWSVWWDREIPPGKSFDLAIESELNAARCVLVLWSKQSVRSNWVKSEASAAAERDRLVPVLIDQVVIPLEFRRIEAADLWDWDGYIDSPEFDRLVSAIRQILSHRPPVRPGDVQPVYQAATPIRRIPTRKWPLWIAALAATAILVAVLVFAKQVLESLREVARPLPGTSVAEGVETLPSDNAAAGDAGNPAQDVIPIEIDGRIDDGFPAPGAGNIERPFGRDEYVFTAPARQGVYFRMLGHSPGMGGLFWSLADDRGMQVFNTCLDCGEPGVQTLTAGGRYTLTVGGNDAATGTYRLQVFSVPPSGMFDIKIGDVIKENMPGAGAGAIESPGATDVYRFAATARQRVYFRMLEHSTGMGGIVWRLTDENEMEIFSSCLACGEPGVHALLKSGPYTLTVGNSRDPATGIYQLQLLNVPAPDQMLINIGDKIVPGSPAAGAGTIERPGAEDVYSFTATPGQTVSFQLLEYSKGMEYLNWRLTDPDGQEVFSMCLGCSSPGRQTLSKGGRYTVTFGNSRNPATGTYAFEILPQ